MSAVPSCVVEIAGGVARLWLDRPAVRNAFDGPLVRELTQTIDDLGRDPTVRVVVLGGRGSAFCAGADLAWMAQLAQQSAAVNLDDALQLARLFVALDACPKPTIARVHGACFGGGIGLVAACDLAVVTLDARFAFSEVRLGLLPATIAPYCLRAIGHRAASRYMLTAEPFDGVVAAQLGLASVAVAAAALDPTIDGLVTALLEGAPQAQANTRRLLRGLAGRPIDAAVLAETAASIAGARASDEGHEGLRALRERRAPAWAPRRPGSGRDRIS